MKYHNKQYTNKNNSINKKEINHKELMSNWKNYLLHERFSDHLINNDLERLEWTNYMNNKEKEGRVLFHLVLTYKTFEGRDHTETDANKNFINFYTKAFLPFLLGTRNYNRPQHRAIQPICLAFLDEHAPKPIENTKQIGAYDCRFVDRLHHHAIIAVHPDNVNLMRKLDKNHLIKSSAFNSVMTLFYRECEPQCLLYASKLMGKYPDYLMFSGFSHTNEKYKRVA